MSKALWAAALLFALPVFAQETPDGGTAGTAAATPVAETTPDGGVATPMTQAQTDEVRREVQAQLDAAKKEMREEMRAQLASQSAASGWSDEWTEEKRKLELFVPNGYLRVRPELYHKPWLGWIRPDPSGYFLFPKSPRSQGERTFAGANMRFRFEPTINVSEEVRIKSQIDVFDNLELGSTPEYAFSKSGYDSPYGILNESQVPPRSAINSAIDSILAKRVWGEVSTPVGILRFGRMGSQWGVGMLHNDGNCLDCDWGDTVDRLMFVSEPLPGYYIAPAIDFNIEGPAITPGNAQGQPFDQYNSDDAHSLVLVLARRDTDQQIRAKLEAVEAVLNYGIHFEYRTQKFETYVKNPSYGAGGDTSSAINISSRDGSLYQPDLWAKYERRHFRLELELAGVFGNFHLQDLVDPTKQNSIQILQFGGVLQSEFKLANDRAHLGMEVGFASGDRAPGFGERPGRFTGTAQAGGIGTQAGDIDGPQIQCNVNGAVGCSDGMIRNFRFNRDYRIDEILFRQIIGGVTDAVYFKPTFKYDIASGFDVHASAVYSRSIYSSSTPSTTDNSLGIEIDAGLRYQTDDGFFSGVTYAILFPLSGLQPVNDPTLTSLETAQALRAVLGIKF